MPNCDCDWRNDDEDDDALLPGHVYCPSCEEQVPKDHLETDTGVCITCEDGIGDDDDDGF